MFMAGELQETIIPDIVSNAVALEMEDFLEALKDNNLL